MISFTQLTNQVHLINDIILSDMVCGIEDVERITSFSHRLLAMKYWFSRISWANKNRYVLALLEDVRSAWTLSLLLKSMWNCRPKDAVLSANEQPILSSYDQVPLDHNRTALPIAALAQAMKNDRLWFLTLESKDQAMVLSELLTIAGGPIMWAVLKRAQILYNRYRDMQMQNIQECIVVVDQPHEKPQTTPDKGKKEVPGRKISSDTADNKQIPQQLGHAQKELEVNLAAWNATIKSLKDTQKLEELEITFNDGTKRKIWKVNRQKSEIVETVDFLQLLPSAIGKRVLLYLPRSQFADYARVNKYWAYLVDEFRAELTARQKINMDFEKLNDAMLRHDVSMELVEQIHFPIRLPSSIGNFSTAISQKVRPPLSIKASEKSAAAFSVKHFLNERMNKTIAIPKPISKMADLTDRLEQRGAVDENLWSWCENILHHLAKEGKNVKTGPDKEGGVLHLGSLHFPSPMMKHDLQVPLSKPLCKDPARLPAIKPRRNIFNATMTPAQEERRVKRFSLWTKDTAQLYPVYKVYSYQAPFDK